MHGVHAHIQSCTAHAHHQRIHSALFQSVHIDILGEGTAIQYRCSGARINIESTMPYAHAGHRACGRSHILEFTIDIIISFHGYGAELLLSAAQACIVQLSSHLRFHIHIAYSDAPGLAYRNLQGIRRKLRSQLGIVFSFHLNLTIGRSICAQLSIGQLRISMASVLHIGNAHADRSAYDAAGQRDSVIIGLNIG